MRRLASSSVAPVASGYERSLRPSDACISRAVNIDKVQSKPKRRGLSRGRRPGWKKAIVQLREGQSIEIFEGAQV